MSRLKVAVPAIAAVLLSVFEYGRKALEAFHTADFVTHLNESPTLTQVQSVLGTQTGLAFLVATIFVLSGVVLKLWRGRQSTNQSNGGAVEKLAPSRISVETGTVSGKAPRRKRRMIEEQLEVFRRTTRYEEEEEEGDP